MFQLRGRIEWLIMTVGGGEMHAVHVWRCSKLLVVVLRSFVFQSMLQSRQWFPVIHSRSSTIYREWLKYKVKSILQCISVSHLLYGIKKYTVLDVSQELKHNLPNCWIISHFWNETWSPAFTDVSRLYLSLIKKKTFWFKFLLKKYVFFFHLALWFTSAPFFPVGRKKINPLVVWITLKGLSYWCSTFAWIALKKEKTDSKLISWGFN